MIERSQLLPRSGVGVVAPWLVVAPRGNPILRIDIRLLDRVQVLADDDEYGRAATLPWNEDPRCYLLITRGELDVTLYISDGPEAAARIVQEAAPLMRDGGAGHLREAPPDLERFVIFDDAAVVVHEEFIEIGASRIPLDQVRADAHRGANLALGGGALMQAAVAMLVVEAAGIDTTWKPIWLGMELDDEVPRIAAVVPDSAADRAGVRAGDEIVSLAVSSLGAPWPHVTLQLGRGDDLVRVTIPVSKDDLERERWTSPIGIEAPELRATTLDGTQISLRTGHVVMLDFFGSWCESLEARVARLSALQNKRPELRIVGVSSDSAADLRGAAASATISYALVSDEDGAIARLYQASPPTLVVIDTHGVVRHIEGGHPDFDALEAELMQLTS